jgi:transposase
MSYSVDLRERVVSYVRGGGSPTEAARLFRVSRTPLHRWLGAPDLRPKPAKERRRKLDKAALAAHVRDFPEALLRERAAHFGVTTFGGFAQGGKCIPRISHVPYSGDGHQGRRPRLHAP